MMKLGKGMGWLSAAAYVLVQLKLVVCLVSRSVLGGLAGRLMICDDTSALCRW